MSHEGEDMKKAIILSLCLSLLLSLAAGAQELKIGLIPEQNVFAQQERYRIIGDYIEKQTGIKVHLLILPRYGNILENFKSADMDGAFLGSFTGALAAQKMGIEFLARPVNLNGNSTYCGYIFARKGSKIKDVRDMKQKRIVFVDRATTAGYVFPLAYFKQHGISDIDAYFLANYFAGSHDAAIQAVLDGKADVGCAKDTVYNLMADRNPAIKAKLRIIAVSPMVPSNGLGVRKELSVEIKQKLSETLVGMHKNPAGRKALQDFRALRFITTGNNDYEPVLKIAKQAGIDVLTYRYSNK